MNTYGKRGIGNFGVVNMVSGGVNLRANHRNTYGNRGIGNFGGGKYFVNSSENKVRTPLCKSIFGEKVEEKRNRRQREAQDTREVPKEGPERARKESPNRCRWEAH